MKSLTIMGLAIAVGVLVGQAAFGDSIAWRTGGGGTYTDVVVDDTRVEWWNANNYGTASAFSASYGGSGNTNSRALIGWTTLFTAVPTTNGGNPIVIDSANLLLTSANPSATTLLTPVTVYRMTTPWLTGAAGTNQTRVVGNAAWAGGAFSTADYSTTDGVTFPGDTAWMTVTNVDITALMRDIYASGVNAGFVIVPTSSSGTANLSSAWYSSDPTMTDLGTRPVLEMTYHYAGTSVPEPATMLLLGTGALGVMGFIRRRKMN